MSQPSISSFKKSSIKKLALVATVTVMGLVVAPGCSSDESCVANVATRTRPEVDFSKYRTFAVKEVDGSGLGGAGGLGGAQGNAADIPTDVKLNIDKANKEAVKVLKEGGLVQVFEGDEKPDLWLGSAAAADEDTGVYWVCVPGWYWWGWYPYWDPCAWLEPIPVEYTVGSLMMVLVDSDTEQVVYGGIAQGVVGCSDDTGAVIEEAVGDIFYDYPFEEIEP